MFSWIKIQEGGSLAVFQAIKACTAGKGSQPGLGCASLSHSVTSTWKTFVKLTLKEASSQLTVQTFNLKRNWHTDKALDFIMALPSSLQTLSLVSALQIPDSSHIYRLHEPLQTPEGAGTDSRGYAPCLAMAKASHGLTLNCFSNLSKSLNKDQSTSPASTVAVLWFTSNLPLQEQARKGKGNSSFLDTGQSVQISL